MAECKNCGKKINWWDTGEQKIPTDGTEEFNIFPSKDGPLVGVTSNGMVVIGEPVGDANEQGYFICRLKHICKKG